MSSSPRPRKCETSRYRHGCDPPERIKAVSPYDCKRLDNVGAPRAAAYSASVPSLVRLIQLQELQPFDFIRKDALRC